MEPPVTTGTARINLESNFCASRFEQRLAFEAALEARFPKCMQHKPVHAGVPIGEHDVDCDVGFTAARRSFGWSVSDFSGHISPATPPSPFPPLYAVLQICTMCIK